jgi:hypothetical protein
MSPWDYSSRPTPPTNITVDERLLGIQSALTQIESLTDSLNAIAQSRAGQLRESHQRVRAAVGGGQATVTARIPPDVLGVYVLLPAVG